MSDPTWESLGLGAVFHPSGPVNSAEELVGRREQLRDLLLCFSDAGQGIPLLTGPQGIGKTSLLTVFANLLMSGMSSDNYARLDLAGFAPQDRPRVVHWLRCDHTMTDADALSSRILLELRTAGKAVNEAMSASNPEYAISSTVPVKKVLLPQDDKERNGVDDLVAELAQQAERISGEVFLLLDECENLPWLRDLFGFVRRFDRSKIKFVLAMREHAVGQFQQSQYNDFRLPHGIDVPCLDERDRGELTEFFHQKSAGLKRAGVDLHVDPAAMALISRKSGGEPWYLHMLGNEILKLKSDPIIRHVREGKIYELTVNTEMVRTSEIRVASTYLHGLYTEQYRSLAQGAPKREELIRTLALLRSPEITSDFVKHVKEERGGNPKDAVRRLSKDAGVLVRHGAVWRFANHQFRVFCRLTPPLNAVGAEFAALTIESWRRKTGDQVEDVYGYG